jgi:hypothetical protein
MIEEWKEIEGFSRYKVSNTGKIWDTKNNREVAQVLAGVPQYYYVNINSDSGERKLKRVHRFVAEAFVEGRSEDCNIVDHIDRDKFNNNYTNLRWTDTSGNQRNLDNSVYVEYEGKVQLLRDVCENLYEDDQNAYNYLVNYKDVVPFENSLARYNEYLVHGFLGKEVVWKGHTTYLNVLCKELGKDLEPVMFRLRQGWDLWNAIYNVPREHVYSVQIPCEQVTGHWFPSKKYLLDHFKNYGDKFIELVSTATYQELSAYDSLDHARQTVLGVTGTIPELCSHFGVEPSMVDTRRKRYGMTLEEALTQSKKRIKVVYLDGQKMSTKALYEYFNLNAKHVNAIKSKKGFSIHETLEYFGVDISKIDLKY